MLMIASNKKAFHDYEIVETIEAGLVLTGDEVKSVRKRQVSINDAFAAIHQGELSLVNCHITPYSHAYIKSEAQAKRSRTLLLHKKELHRLIGDISRKGITIVPLKMYVNDRGFIKVELGIAKHKKKIDKKRDLKERDIRREVAREGKVRLG